MKTITLLFVLMSFSLQAQDFPDPYCDIDPEGTTLEELTAVTFNQMNINNENAESILVDKTDSIAVAVPGETYTLSVEGDTKGDFTNDVVAFIDWNQNDVLDDENEVYEVGTLENSDGDDGVAVSMDITVPADAEMGETRIRITKTYTDEEGEGGAPPSTALINPCAIEFDAFGQGAQPGFGQALDFTLSVEALSTETFDTAALSVYPIPTQDILNIDYKSPLKTVQVFDLLGREVLTKNDLNTKEKLDLSDLSGGTYILKLQSKEGQKHSLKILKQ